MHTMKMMAQAKSTSIPVTEGKKKVRNVKLETNMIFIDKKIPCDKASAGV